MSSVELAAAMTMGSLFDGIGGFPLGAARYGIKMGSRWERPDTASKRFGPVRSNRSLWK